MAPTIPCNKNKRQSLKISVPVGRVRAAGTGSLFRIGSHLIDKMHSDNDGGDDAPQRSEGSVVGYGQDSDADSVASDIEEDFSQKLADFQMEKEALCTDEDSNCSDRVPSCADSAPAERSD